MAAAAAANPALSTRSHNRAALSAALFVSGLTLGGLAISACGGQATSTTAAASTPSASTTTTVSTVTTSTHTVVGTTPFGTTVTETTTQLTTTPAGPSGVALETGPQLAPPSPTLQGQTIDGIQCNRLDQLAYQAYAHLQIYFKGHSRVLPGGIGLVTPSAQTTGTTTTYKASLCSYWVRTRAANGLIEVRSPVPETYTLGDLFDIWAEPLTARQVARAHGPVTAIVNGRTWHGNPRAIPLREHESIELAVGRPVPPFVPVDWSVTQL